MSNISSSGSKSLRYGMFIPLTFLIAAMLWSGFSCFKAKQDISADLNDAMFALANENRDLWVRPDTVAALRHLYETTHKPVLYQASEINFKHALLNDEAYYTLALVDETGTVPEVCGHKIVSDSILIIPDNGVCGYAIRLQGFADCSVASLFAASDQTLPGLLLVASMLSTLTVFLLRREEEAAVPALDDVKLTPMQRKLTKLLTDAPGRKVDKATLCKVLWDNKSNAEESLYTLVRRTKAALAYTNVEIICNRGDSYELRVNA